MKLSVEAAAAKAAYLREWRQKNRDKIEQAQEKYWLKKSEEMKKASGFAEVQPDSSEQEVADE